MSKMKRLKRIEFTATEDEYKFLTRAARAAGVPAGTFCRMSSIERATVMMQQNKKAKEE